MSLGAGSRVPGTVARFALVGLGNTVVDVVLFWLLEPALGIWTANVVSTSAGMVLSFWMNGRHTFGIARPTVRQAGVFLATNATTMWLLQPLLIELAVAVAGLPVPAAKLLALGASTIANFVLYRGVVFRPAPRSAGPAAAREAARR